MRTASSTKHERRTELLDYMTYWWETNAVLPCNDASDDGFLSINVIIGVFGV